MTHLQRRKRHEEIASFINDGHTINEAISKFGVSYNIIYLAIKKKGIVPKEKFRNTNLRLIAEILNTQDSYTKIAKKFNITPQAVSLMGKRLKEVGINIPER